MCDGIQPVPAGSRPVLPQHAPVEPGSVPKCAGAADGMDARQEASHPPAVVLGAELGPAAARPTVHGVTEAFVLEERAAVVHVRRDHRDLGTREFQRKLVLLENRGVGPALGSVELHHDRRGVFSAHLVDAVFVTIQGQDATVARVPQRFDGADDDVGGQRGIRMRGIHCFDCTGSRTLAGTSSCSQAPSQA